MNTCKECIHWGFVKDKLIEPTADGIAICRICVEIERGGNELNRLLCLSGGGGAVYCYTGPDFGCIKWESKLAGNKTKAHSN